MNPKISIITVSFNSEKTIEETIQSVINQSYDNLEYIIIDGDSTDNTMNIVNKYREKIAIVVSEKDKGISDAFNKGIKQSTGEIIGIINSDDILLPFALENVSAAFKQKEIGVCRGNMIIWNDLTKTRVIDKPTMKFNRIPFGLHTCHPSTFISKKVYNQYGLFKLDFKYFMDVDLLIRFYKKGVNFIHIDTELTMFRIGGVTATPEKYKRNERKKLLLFNGFNSWHYFIFETYIFVREIVKKILNLFGEDLKLKLRYKYNK